MWLLLIALAVFSMGWWLWQTRHGRAHWSSLPTPPTTPRAKISLTTLPSRSSKITPTLYSLLDQTVPVPIEIHIPTQANPEPGKQYRFPRAVRNHPSIRIVTHPVDLGPGMKFIPAIQTSEVPIIVVDDDNIYPPTLVEDLLSSPSPGVKCTRGWTIPRSGKWEDATVRMEVATPEPVSVITGCGGYLIPVSVAQKLRGEIDKFPFPEARKMDDIWISGLLEKHGIPRWVVPIRQRHFSSVTAFFTPQHLQPGRQEANNKVLSFFTWKK